MPSITGWITVNGKHIPLIDGESSQSAINRMNKEKQFRTKSSKEAAKKIAEYKSKGKVTVSDEELENDYIKSSYDLAKEANFIDKDTTFKSYKKEFISNKDNMSYFNDNKEAFRNQYIKRKENENKPFAEKTKEQRERAYKNEGIKYTCRDYKDIINYQLGNDIKGDKEQVGNTVEVLETMCTKDGFSGADRQFYRGLQNVDVSTLKAGDIMAFRPTISSWTDDIEVAQRFATNDKNSVILINTGGHYGDISYFTNDLRNESEVIKSGNENIFKIVKKVKKGNTTYLYTDQSFYNNNDKE